VRDDHEKTLRSVAHASEDFLPFCSRPRLRLQRPVAAGRFAAGRVTVSRSARAGPFLAKCGPRRRCAPLDRKFDGHLAGGHVYRLDEIVAFHRRNAPPMIGRAGFPIGGTTSVEAVERGLARTGGGSTVFSKPGPGFPRFLIEGRAECKCAGGRRTGGVANPQPALSGT